MCHAILLLRGNLESPPGSDVLTAGCSVLVGYCGPHPAHPFPWSTGGELAQGCLAQLLGGCKEHFTITSWCYLMERIAWWRMALSPPPTSTPAFNINLSVLSIFQASVHRRVSLRSEWLTGGDGLKQIQAILYGKFFFFVQQLFWMCYRIEQNLASIFKRSLSFFKRVWLLCQEFSCWYSLI